MALSVSHEDDYVGSGISFREFIPGVSRAPAGTALVLSSVPPQEVEETTEGLRYNRIPHVFS